MLSSGVTALDFWRTAQYVLMIFIPVLLCVHDSCTSAPVWVRKTFVVWKDYKIPRMPNSITSALIPDRYVLWIKVHTFRNSWALMSHFTRQCGDWHHGTYLNSQKTCLPFYWTYWPTPVTLSAERNTSGWGNEESERSGCKSNSFRHLQPIFRSAPTKEVSHLPRQGDQILPELSLLCFLSQPSTISIKRQVSRRADFLFGCWK